MGKVENPKESLYSKSMIFQAKPFVKWAGGKTQLLEEIRKHYPSQIEKYCEPFVGGGAVLFDVLQKAKPQKVLINDINPNLINTYEQVKSNVDRLCEKLNQFQNQYLSKSDDERKSFFYEKRERFNEIKLNDAVIEPVKITNTKIEKAALFILLNKTCFNGLYRVNKKGEFNVPFNNAKNPLICDEENLRACSELLQNVKITCDDYKNCADFCDDLGVPATSCRRAIRGSAVASFLRFTFVSLRNASHRYYP